MRSLKLFVLLLFVSITAFGQQRRFITFQGRLLQASQPFNPSGGTTNITFNIPSAGWTEVHTNVPVISGYYAVVLGQRSTPVGIDASLFRDSVKRRLTVRIGGSVVESVDLYAPIESDPTVPAWVKDVNPWSTIPGRPRTIDTSNTNENQTLVINGSNLSIQPNGNTVTLPAGGGTGNSVNGPFTVQDTTCRIQAQNIAVGTPTPGSQFWQSFRPVQSGRLCAIQLDFATPSNVSQLSVRIFNGQGNASQPIAIIPSITVVPNSPLSTKTLTIPSSQNISLIAGSVYTVEVASPSNTTIDVRVTQTDTYSEGTSNSSGKDLTFSVSLSGNGNANLLVNNQGNVGVGIANPQSRMHIDGRYYDRSGAVMPVGTILPFGGDTTKIPPGWLFCNGTPKSRTSFPDLFDAIGTNWGEGDGVGTFNLPDLRGYFLRGWTNNTARDPDALTTRKASPELTGPDIAPRVGSYQRFAFQGHWHEVNNSVSNLEREGILTGSNANGVAYASPSLPPNSRFRAREVIEDALGNGTPQISKETRPRNAYVHYIIKY